MHKGPPGVLEVIAVFWKVSTSAHGQMPRTQEELIKS